MHTVELTREDKILLLEALAASEEIKERKLQNPQSREQMHSMYLDAAHKFLEPISIHDTRKNIMTWFIDQLKHSGKLWDSELAKRAVAVAQSVIDDDYGHYKSITTYQDLFKNE